MLIQDILSRRSDIDSLTDSQCPSQCPHRGGQEPLVFRRREGLAKWSPTGALAKTWPAAIEQGKGTTAECEAALKENRRTLQRDLKLLVAKGFVREVAAVPPTPRSATSPPCDKL